MAQTTSDLIANIKTRGSFPTADDLFSNSDYLQILNDEMLSKVSPLITRINEEFFLTYFDSSVTTNQDAYRMPKRAVGGLLRDVQFIDSGGAVSQLPRLFEEDKFSTTQGQNGYYIKGNQIILSPTPTVTSGTLRQVYVRRPSSFVLPTACAEITSISGTTITVSSLPSTMATGTSIDFVQGDSPYDLLQMDTAIASVSGTTLTFGSVPTDLIVGDYICLAGQTCVPMVPEELVPYLAQAALCICLASKKDEALSIELKKLDDMEDSIIDLLSPRVRNNAIKIKTRNNLLRTW